MLHTLVALVEDKPGVLNRVASLFRRRAFNIESLTVGRTELPGISRMTIVMDSDQVDADRVMAYLYKLVNVLEVEDLRDVPAVARDLALVKVAVGGHDRGQLLRVVDETRAHIVDSSDQTMTLALSPAFGEPGKYKSVFFPMQPGDYTFRIFGRIDGTDIDESFTSSPQCFGAVEDPAPLQFPSPE